MNKNEIQIVTIYSDYRLWLLWKLLKNHEILQHVGGVVCNVKNLNQNRLRFDHRVIDLLRNL